jgi:uncharacterized membrane protein YfcA
MWTSLLYVVAGLGVGALIGLTGIGGGSVMTPILMFGFGQPPAVAVGTDLAFAATTRFVASTPGSTGATVDWQVVRRLAYGSVPATLAVFALLRFAPPQSQAPPWIMREGLGAMLLATAAAVAFQGRAQQFGLQWTASALERAERWKPPLTVLGGALVGLAVMLTSVGAGALTVTLLAALYPLRLTGDRLVATDIAHALPLTIAAAAGHAALGHLDVTVLGLLLIGAVPGALLAQRTKWRAPTRLLRPLLATLLIGGAARVLGV